MRVLVDVGHPGHVHFYKHVIWRLQDRGHEVLISARDKDVTLALLDHYGFPYRTLSAIGNGHWGLVREFLQREWALLRLIREFDPDVVTEIGGLFIAPICRLLGKSAIVFTDSEPVPLDKYFTYPFASVICTPDCFMRDLGKRHIRYAGYHELAYLHPDYFGPDPTILNELGVSEGEPFSVLRFVAWKASHDMRQHGFSIEVKREIVQTLNRFGRVFITSEMPLPEEFEPYRISVPPHRIHHVLYYARLFMGDGATMATEAGILGTPAVRSSSLALNMGNFVELMERYGLVYSYCDSGEALQRAVQLLEWEGAKAEWGRRREGLLAEKIDVTTFLCDLLEKYTAVLKAAKIQ
jgi:predicted glycosyltransferase